MKIYAVRLPKNPTEILQYFKGTDYWIKVGEWHSKSYIRVIDMTDTDDIEKCVVRCNWVPERLLLRNKYRRLDAHDSDINEILSDTTDMSMKYIEVIRPLDLLTTEEVIELYRGYNSNRIENNNEDIL